MKKLATILCIAGTTMSLSACGSNRGDIDTAPPYATERTASHGSVVEGSMKKHHKAAPTPAPAADRVFQEYQAK